MCRLSTAIREFGALKGLPYYEPDLLADILSGRAARIPRLTSSAIDDAMDAYNVNEPQAKAILGAMESKGFALIQGCVQGRCQCGGADDLDLPVPERPRLLVVWSVNSCQRDALPYPPMVRKRSSRNY
jgi:hypothetical protein